MDGGGRVEVGGGGGHIFGRVMVLEDFLFK